jgi:hypothetical protein
MTRQKGKRVYKKATAQVAVASKKDILTVDAK